jgi:anti-sigma factor RsiW
MTSLLGAYLDSELDARTTLEIQQHLADCPDCARTFAAEAKLEAGIAADLKRGRRTASLWDRIEQQVTEAAEAQPRRPRAARVSPPAPWWREWFWPSPQAWAGLAATWVLVAVASFATREPASLAATHPVRPPSPEQLQVLRQQRQLLAELSGPLEQPAGGKPKTPPPQPRSQRAEPHSKA